MPIKVENKCENVSTIDNIFHNHYFKQTVTALSLYNQISFPTVTSLQHLKSLFPSEKITFVTSY